MSITKFAGAYEFLSNFYPIEIELDGEIYPSLEHAYQASKTDIPAERARVQSCATPAEAKQMGKLVTHIPNWDQAKIQIMEDLLRIKFSNPSLAARLGATGTSTLIEGNNWKDRFWGMVSIQGAWVGKNHLGLLLMKIRSELLSGDDSGNHSN